MFYPKKSKKLLNFVNCEGNILLVYIFKSIIKNVDGKSSSHFYVCLKMLFFCIHIQQVKMHETR